MNATYQITPEMLGLSWRRLLLWALRAGLAGLIAGVLVSFAFHGHVTVGGALGLVAGAAISVLLMRPLSRTKLRITDDRIEESDGPAISKDAIERVNEYSDEACSGIEIIGKGKPRWLRKYSIFVPSSLPDYVEVRNVVLGWAAPQNWHRV